MNAMQLLKAKRQEIMAVASRHGARNIRVFGSAVRGEESAGSDIDFLVEMQKGRSLYDLIAFQEEMERILGRKADVVSESGINRYLKERILSEAKAL